MKDTKKNININSKLKSEKYSGGPLNTIQKIIYTLVTSCSFLIKMIFILAILAIIGILLVWTYIRPMYVQAQKDAYEALSNISESTFRKLSDTTIYDTNGKKIGQISAIDYTHVSIDKISDDIQHAYIAAEDRRFFEHNGVDLQGISRAGLSLILNRGEITQGGSTITQQIVKNCLLTQEQSYSRKLAEILIAPSIEEKFSKSEIMEIYCNTNYYGNNCYGVESACQYYFGKSANDVTLAEAAMIAGISNSPNRYNPEADEELAKQKAESVLNDMLEAGYITEDERTEALDYEYTFVGEHPDTMDESTYAATYAIYCATLELMKQDGFTFQYTFSSKKEENAYNKAYQAAYKEKSELLRSGGYQIYTTLDMEKQASLQKSVDDTLQNFDEKTEEGKYALQSAAVCVDNETGAIAAIVGGRGTDDEYNRAFLSDRQPGSTIKPLLDYAPAIECGLITGSTIMTDEPTYSVEGDASSYSPKNYNNTYLGDMTAREALARSINTIAFQLFLKTGNEQALSYLENLKFNSLSYADNTADAVSIGGFTTGVRVVDMAKGYATLANSGQFIDRTCIQKITHETQGDICTYEQDAPTTQVYSEDTAFIVTDMLQGCVEESYGTAHQYYNSNQVYAAKTGTTNSSKDAWFCGYSAYYTTAVWIGYDTPRKMDMTGGSYPGQIWATFMNEIHEDLPMKDFAVPETTLLKKTDSQGNVTDTDASYLSGNRQYDKRPSNADYMPTSNTETVNAWETEQGLILSKEKAEKAVSEFEDFTFSSLSDVNSLDERYQSVLAVVDEIADEYEQEPYRRRAADKYNSLSGEVQEKWQDALSESESNREEEQANENQIAADNSQIQAAEQLKATRIQKMEWYLEQIKNRSYYNDTTQSLIADAENALERLSGYDEYDTYASKLAKATSKAQQLPTVPATPDIPEDAQDSESIDPNKYQDNSQQEADALKKNRIAKMEEYLSLLAERTVNDASTQLLVADAREALERLSGYDEYDTYAAQLESLESQIQNLPQS